MRLSRSFEQARARISACCIFSPARVAEERSKPSAEDVLHLPVPVVGMDGGG